MRWVSSKTLQMISLIVIDKFNLTPRQNASVLNATLVIIPPSYKPPVLDSVAAVSDNKRLPILILK